jgi:hypothetical protein
MEAEFSSETLVLVYKSKWFHNPEDHNLNTYPLEISIIKQQFIPNCVWCIKAIILLIFTFVEENKMNRSNFQDFKVRFKSLSYTISSFH